MVQVNKDTRTTLSHLALVFLLLTLNKSMPPGKMLMGSKVKDGFYYFFVRVKIISYLVGQENFDIFT